MAYFVSMSCEISSLFPHAAKLRTKTRKVAFSDGRKQTQKKKTHGHTHIAQLSNINYFFYRQIIFNSRNSFQQP